MLLKIFLFTICLEGLILNCASLCLAQTNTNTSGDWTDVSVWSTGATPLTTATVNVNHIITTDQNITITTGTYNFFQNVTDVPSGTAFTLTMTTSGGLLDIKSGITTFEGSATIDNSTIIIRTGATLILGATTIGNNSQITIESGASLIINGNLTNNNNGSGDLTVAGTVLVKGNYNAPVGSVNVSGSGTFDTTGTITTTGSSDVFGLSNDCNTGPCSGNTLTCTFTNTITPNGQVVCSSFTPATLTSNNSAGTPTYLWQSSTDNVTFSSATGTNTNSTYVFAGALSQTTWYRVRVTSNSGGGSPCTNTSASIKVTILSGGGWKGITNSWNTATNWCSGSVPISTTDVTVSPFPSASGLFMPIISTGVSANTNNLTINDGASISLTGTSSLNILANFTNNGSYADVSTSTVTLAGTSPQTIGGITSNTFNNLVINNTSSSTAAITLNNNNVIILGTLTLTSGNTNLNGFTLKLGSSSASTGTLSRSAAWFYGGNMTRWMGTSAQTIGAGVTGADLFPIGTSTNFRPLQLGYTVLAAGGSVKINHTGAVGSTAVAFSDINPGNAVQVISNSYWKISTVGFSGVGATPFTIQTSGTGFGTIGALTDLRLVQSSAPISGSSAGTNAGSTSNPKVVRTNISAANISNNNLYIGSINSAQSPLPLQLLSFESHTWDDGILLTWTTSLEKEFDRFEIEHALNDTNFKPIASIKGRGNEAKENNYSYLDKQCGKGRNYYRLKNIDLNGTFNYSSIIQTNWKFSEEIRLYPNPIPNRKFIIELDILENTEPLLKIFNLLQMECLSLPILANKSNVELPDIMLPGIYFVKIFSGIKQRVIKVVIL